MIFFLSSSFADMQVERDLMMFEVMPTFRSIAAGHGDYAAHLDLRWGIPTWNETTEIEVSKRVLASCERAIEDSRPYIIIFLSKRYGSTELTPNGKSVTEYEIDHALKEKSRCIICLRDISKEDIPQNYWDTYFNQEDKIDALSKKLRANYPQAVIEYTTEWQSSSNKLDNFKTKDGLSLQVALLEKMQVLCEEDWKVADKLNLQEQELIANMRLARRKAKEFFGREVRLASLLRRSKNSTVHTIEGEVGVGKSTICAKIADDLNQSDYVCCLFAGTSNYTSSTLGILKLMVYYLEEVLSQSHCDFSEDYAKWKMYFLEKLLPLVEQSENQVYFIIDGLDQLVDDKNRNELNFLPLHSVAKVHFLLSYAPSRNFSLPLTFINLISYLAEDAIDEAEIERRFQLMLTNGGENAYRELLQISYGVPPEFVNDLSQAELFQISKQDIEYLKASFNADDYTFVKNSLLQPLKKIEVQTIIEGLLSLSGRALFAQTSAAVCAKRNSTNPLYLRLIATLLNLISSRQLATLRRPAGIVGITVSWIKDLSDDIAEAANELMVKAANLLCTTPTETVRAVRTIAASRNGLRLSDLQQIFGGNFKQADFTLLQYALDDFFVVQSDGRITFPHSLIKAGVNLDSDLDYTQLVAKHIKKLPVDDTFRAEEIFYYAQQTRDFELVAELCGEAWCKKNQSQKNKLIYSIFTTTLADESEFFSDLLNNHLHELSPQAIGGIWLFFTDGREIQDMFHGTREKHEAFIKILRGICENWRYFQKTFDDYGVENTDYRYYLVVMLQAQYNLLIGEIDLTAKLCYEVIIWSKKIPN